MAKEFRYFQILIVKTAIHHFSVDDKNYHLPYNTWHWAEFTTYTNTISLSKLLCFW